MPFVVETGSGVADANSLCSVEFADQYFADRGNKSWIGSLQEKQAALVKATDYFEYRFGPRLISYRTAEGQSLSFPRPYYNGVPTDIKKGIAEYAIRALKGALVPDPVFETNGAKIKRSKKKLGPLEKEVEYESRDRSIFRPYPAADLLFASFLNAVGNRVYR